ncbi:MAG TPA: hypothetical protein DCM05_05585 [Elusimicrobia bacterium]|nr:hypothetical protein [Elusimicrobiota bacterium]
MARKRLPRIPAKAEAGFPIVGIGASAGGLAAFEAFFSGMPAGEALGMAFVLVQHLAPDHKSLLAELVKRYTRMQVCEAEDGMKVQPGCVYIIPPNRDMAFLDGALHLLEPAAPHGQRLAVDFFFRSLAQDQQERAVCVVLSGTGGDGTQGVRAVKGAGGMAMAQDPASAEHDGMPRSAIATGLVDFVLPPSEMPARLAAYAARAYGKAARAAAPEAPEGEDPLKKIFILLRAQTGHDFSHYKRNTIVRRVERRMAVQQVDRMDRYVRVLREHPAETEALFRDLLIGVTHFFRDPKEFQALEEKVLPRLFADKPAGSTVRVWVPACSTGEEAYSIAILLQERLDALKRNTQVVVFATDIDPRALECARAGVYPASIAADVSPKRLARFFSQDAKGGSYRILKSIRDMMIFSEQDAVKDPPFSRLDLISCRNLLIYLGPELHKKLMSLFHYALNPGGTLFLGTAETVGESAGLFGALDRKAKLYLRKESAGAFRSAASRFLPAPGGLGRSPARRVKEEHLQPVHKEPATGDQELQSSNEELQSLNEELQSAVEELETSKEELQSVNEELSTVNAELQSKVGDLTRVNNDMNNLLAGTGIGTIFVDHQLNIQRFTPAITQVINLIPTDVGRPVGHIVSNLAGYDRLSEDIREVLDTLAPKELEVRTKAGARLILRIRPYRTLENVIEGAVVTFVDITGMERKGN